MGCPGNGSDWISRNTYRHFAIAKNTEWSTGFSLGLSPIDSRHRIKGTSNSWQPVWNEHRLIRLATFSLPGDHFTRSRGARGALILYGSACSAAPCEHREKSCNEGLQIRIDEEFRLISRSDNFSRGSKACAPAENRISLLFAVSIEFGGLCLWLSAVIE